MLVISAFVQTGVYAGEAKVVQVIDGGTISVSYGDNIVNCAYIGLFAPEPDNPVSSQALQYSKDLLEGKTVRLEFDELKRDGYGSLLAYVYCDQVFVNAELIKRGYASVMIISPNTRHGEDFLKFEREAREAGRGLWAKPDEIASPTPSIPALQKQITLIKAEIDKLSRKIALLSKLIEELQVRPENALSPAQNPEPEKTDEQAEAVSTGNDQAAQTVCVTKSGTKYHKLGCRHLKGRQYSEIPMEEAKRRGLQPCRDCFR